MWLPTREWKRQYRYIMKGNNMISKTQLKSMQAVDISKIDKSTLVDVTT